MEEKKYEMLMDAENTIVVDDHTLHRIKALKDFGNVRKGAIGGYIEKESNLSHNVTCWVYGNARVYEKGAVYGNARVGGNSEIYDAAKVYESSYVNGNAKVFGNARVYGKGAVYGNAHVGDNSEIYDDAEIHGNACIYDNAKVCEDGEVYGNAKVYEHAKVFGNTAVYGAVTLYGDAKVFGNTAVYGDATVFGGATIESDADYITFGSVGSEYGTLTAYRTKDGGVSCTRGCFKGTLEEFEKAVEVTHEDNEYAKEYSLIIGVIKNRFNK